MEKLLPIKFLPLRIFDLVYGLPASGKSEGLARVAEQALRENPGSIVRIVVGDGSAMTYEHLVMEGKAEIVEYPYREWPLDTVQKLCKGWWPKNENGTLNPHGQLYPPDERLKHVCMYIFEGLSVMGVYIMGSVKGGLAQLAGEGQKLGQDTPFRIVQAEMDPKTGKPANGPGTSFGGNPPSHYGIAQRNLVDAVMNSKQLPCHVMWVAHEATNDPEKDVLTKELMVGPEVAGKALTANIQRIFGNTFHCQSVPKRIKTKDTHTDKDVLDLDNEYRVYTRDHFAAAGNTMTRYKACTRGVDKIQQFYESTEPGSGLMRIYLDLAEERMKKMAELRESLHE